MFRFLVVDSGHPLRRRATALRPCSPRVAPPAGERVKPLDGLRGIAALVVVITHIALTGTLANAVLSGYSEPMTSRAALLGYTPLHFLWDGTFAVYLLGLLHDQVTGWVRRPGWPVWA
jgi:hypothetical protein